MKKLMVGITIAGILVVALGLAGFAYAQNQTPPTPEAEYPFWHGHMGGFRGHGRGMMGGGYGMMGWEGEDGPMHEAMVAAFSEALGLNSEEIERRHDEGETLWEIAEAEGLSPEEVQVLMSTAHDAALADAVASGWLTEEQAEWMDNHMQGMWSGEYGSGGHCGGGRFNESPRWDTDS